MSEQSTSTNLVQPRTYYLRYDDNWDCQVFLTEHHPEAFRHPKQNEDIISPAQSQGVISGLRTANPGDQQRELELPCNGFPVPDYWIKCSKKSQIMYEKVSAGGEPTAIGPAKRLIEIIPDGIFTKISTYRELLDGEEREARMHKAPEESWYSMNRSLDGFDGRKYTWKTSLLQDLTVVRDDGEVVLKFSFNLWGMKKIGTIDVLEALPSDTLYLLICATWIAYSQATPPTVLRQMKRMPNGKKILTAGANKEKPMTSIAYTHSHPNSMIK